MQASAAKVSKDSSIAAEALSILKILGVPDAAYAKTGLEARSPVTGEKIAVLKQASRLRRRPRLPARMKLS